MKILIMTMVVALPLIALGQTTEPQQTQAQTKETAAPEKVKKQRAEQKPSKAQAKPEASAQEREKTKAENRTQDVNKTESRSSAGQTNASGKTQTKVNVQEFKSRHSEVFSLGRHPKEFFVQRYGASHFRLIGNVYFIFVDGCWVSVDVEGFVYTERVICAGDPDFIVVD
jgi:hypothetical protein